MSSESSTGHVIDELEQLLLTELQYPRINVQELTAEFERADATNQARFQKEHNSYISVKNQLDTLSNENILLRQRISQLERQLVAAQKPDVSPKSANSQGVSLEQYDKERRRRIKAESELVAHRKQGKSLDEGVAANAKRVAIALAHRCIQLSEQVALLKQPTKSNDTKIVLPEPKFEYKEIRETLSGQTAQAKSSAPQISVVSASGWGISDDDDLFSSLN